MVSTGNDIYQSTDAAGNVEGRATGDALRFYRPREGMGQGTDGGTVANVTCNI